MNEVSLKSLLPRIGTILKLFREKIGKNQAEVAGKAGISTSMLSQIERGAVSPSIDTLHAVCEALGLAISDLFKRVAPEVSLRIQRPGRRLSTHGRGVRFEQLSMSADANHPGELLLVELDPGNKSVGGNGHEGVEMGYVLKGSAVLSVDGNEYAVHEGDSFSINARVPHKIANAGKTVFRAVWSALPPHKDYLEGN